MTTPLVSPVLLGSPFLVVSPLLLASPLTVAAPLVLAVAVALLVPVATLLAVRWGLVAARPRSARRNLAWFALVAAAFLVAPGGVGPGAVVLAVALVGLFEATLLGVRRGAPFRNHFR